VKTTEATIERVNIKAIATQVVIALSFAALYYGMVMYSPVPAKSSLIGMVFGKTLRLANMLRAFVLVTPMAPVGTAIGAYLMKVHAGFGEYLGSSLNLILGLSIYRVSKKVGRSVLKDLVLLATYGFLSGLIITITHAGLAAFMNLGTFTSLLYGLLTFKLVTSTVIYLAGYPFVGVWEYGRRRLSK
jgi:hypothetical protein